MFSKSLIVSVVVLLLGLQANAHAVISPALGVSGKPVRNDAQRPSGAKPCGNANLANIDSSTPVKVGGNGAMSMTITNFNPLSPLCISDQISTTNRMVHSGKDGSRHVKTLMVDETGTGKNFKAVGNGAITQNGDAVRSSPLYLPGSLLSNIHPSWCVIQVPTTDGTQQLAVTMPAGTKCSGGKGKNLCLVSLTTDGGFGNCVVASQAGAGKRDPRAVVCFPLICPFPFLPVTDSSRRRHRAPEQRVRI